MAQATALQTYGASWPPDAPDRSRWRRSPWLVGVLTALTIGVYGLIWFGRTWSQIGRECRDDRCHPVLHVLSLLIPIYGWYRIYLHFAEIDDLVHDAPTSGPPPSLAVAIFIFSLSGIVSVLAPVEVAGLLLLPRIVAVALIVAWGQAALNSYWTVADQRARAVGVGR